jgi:hypothetical protein
MTLITVGSWEPRFSLGFSRVTAERRPSKVIMYFYSEYAAISEQNRNGVRNACTEWKVPIEETPLSFSDTVSSWKKLFRTIEDVQTGENDILIDITTMPRETIWIILDLLRDFGGSVKWVYHRPTQYSGEWLTRDPGTPRLVPKLGGVLRIGAATCLLILSGFDVARTRQVIQTYEPEVTLLGYQTGNQFGNQDLNVTKHQLEFRSDSTVHPFEIDAYSADQGFGAMQEVIRAYAGDMNLIMTSLGPKPSAIAIKRIQGVFPDAALLYAPSNEFNPSYSEGLLDSLFGVWA